MQTATGIVLHAERKLYKLYFIHLKNQRQSKVQFMIILRQYVKIISVRQYKIPTVEQEQYSSNLSWFYIKVLIVWVFSEYNVMPSYGFECF